MPRIFFDSDLHSWEVYPSGGPFGFPDKPKIVFNCVSDPQRRARYVVADGDDADAERRVMEMSEAELRKTLEGSQEVR